MKTSVLFLCIHNSARSQMAEAYLKAFGGGKFAVESAGLEPGVLNPLAVAVMHEDGIDISQNSTQGVNDLYEQGRSFEYVITVCDGASAAKCPIFPGMHKKIAWDFPDPSQFGGSQEEKLERTRNIRDQIRQAVLDFILSLETSSV